MKEIKKYFFEFYLVEDTKTIILDIIILLSSLKKLIINFGIITQKRIFPYRFINESNLNYKDLIPAFEYFNNISQAKYNKYLNSYNGEQFIKTESMKYYIQDYISLYQIIILFNKLIFNKFKLNINKYLILFSLCFGIF